MKMKSVLLLVVAVGCGLVAMLGVQQVLSGGNKPAEKKVRVLVAKAQIPSGTPLDQMNVMFKEVAKEAVPEFAVVSPEQYEERALKTTAFPGQIILQPQLGEKGVFNSSTEIPPGMRVITVAVNLTMIHSGLLKPGDRVDVLVTYKTQKPGRGAMSKTKHVLEYIEVFATDAVREGSDVANANAEIKAKNISLLVTPEQAALIKLAESKGDLHISLRNKADDADIDIADVDDTAFDGLAAQFDEQPEDEAVEEPEPEPSFKEFLARQQPEPPVDEPPAPELWTIDIYHGEDKVTQELELPVQAVEPDKERADLTALPLEPLELPSVTVAEAPPLSSAEGAGWLRTLTTFVKGMRANQSAGEAVAATPDLVD